MKKLIQLKVVAYKMPNGDFRFWCGDCHFWHLHSGLGHRAAHCFNDNSRYRQSGYILMGGTDAPLWVVKDVARGRRAKGR